MMALLQVRLGRERKSSKGGVCYLEFDSIDLAEAFVEANVDELLIDDTSVRVDYDAPREERSRGRDRREVGDRRRDDRDRGDRERSRDRHREERGDRDRSRDRDRDWRPPRDLDPRERGGRDRDYGRDYDDRDRHREREERALDWICRDCGVVNFARRTACFTCGVSKGRDARTVPAVGLNGSGAESDAPVLMVKGLSDNTAEGDLLDAFSPFGQVKEIRLVRDRTTKATRGFSFVEFHDLPSAKAALRAPSIVIDHAHVRVTWARETTRGGVTDRRDGAGSALEVAQEHVSHQGPKRSGFGIPAGFLPDATTGYYINAETGYYYDATTKLYFHPSTQLWYKQDPLTLQLKEYISPEVEAARKAEAEAAEAAAKEAAAAEAKRKAEEEEAAAAAARAIPISTNHEKVKLGLAKAKKAGVGGEEACRWLVCRSGR